jgi:hypothetical protein
MENSRHIPPPKPLVRTYISPSDMRVVDPHFFFVSFCLREFCSRRSFFTIYAALYGIISDDWTQLSARGASSPQRVYPVLFSCEKMSAFHRIFSFGIFTSKVWRHWIRFPSPTLYLFYIFLARFNHYLLLMQTRRRRRRRRRPSWEKIDDDARFWYFRFGGGTIPDLKMHHHWRSFFFFFPSFPPRFVFWYLLYGLRGIC